MVNDDRYATFGINEEEYDYLNDTITSSQKRKQIILSRTKNLSGPTFGHDPQSFERKVEGEQEINIEGDSDEFSDEEKFQL